MRKYSSLLGSSGMAMGLTAAAIAIAVILLSSNFTLINAQSQQVTGQDGEIENGTTGTTFQSTNDDSFSIQVPQGWVIQDVNNTGPTLSEETTQGYAILAQLCPEEQQRPVPSNASVSSTTSCQQAQDVIHIIRYPDLDTRLLANNVTTTNNTMTTIDNILTYHLQKLQEVGYMRMQPVNITDVTLNLRNPETNEIMTTEQGRIVEMTYGTSSAPGEIRRGYFILTATDATAPNVGTTKGYGVFYEGNTTSTNSAAEITTAAASVPPPPSIAEVFDSFELIAAAEAAEDVDEDDDNGGNGDDDNGGNGDDDNGGNGDDDDDDDNGPNDNGVSSRGSQFASDDYGADDDNGPNDNDNGVSSRGSQFASDDYGADCDGC